MDVQKTQERAAELLTSGMHCSESALMALAEGCGIDSPLIPRIATGFAGGISGTKNTCGAVTGGIMGLGLAFGRDGADAHSTPTYEKVHQFLNRFEEAFGTINCFELTQCDLGTPEGRKQFADDGVGAKCMEFTAKAAAIAAEIIDQAPTES